MEVLLSAVASDLVGRLVSFLLRKYQEPGATDDIVRLQRVLLRARVVVEEAEGRQVTNRAMLLQLNQLRREMCRGAYVLDIFMGRAVDPGRRSHATASRPFSSLSPAGGDVVDGRLAVVESLEAALSDVRELVVLLGACPRVARQPYSTYLFMETCMFGRQMEKEEIIGFLLRPSQDLDVLPIIGPREVGKRTLVEHVCLDERVRDHFAEIHRLSSDDLDLPSHDHEHHRSLTDATARSLIVIDFVGGRGADEYESSWRRFQASMPRRGANGESKIIIISRTEAHASLGTAPPLRLRSPRREELWYLFRGLAFGGADPEERPDLLPIAVALFESIPDLPPFRPFVAANKLAASLRADLSARAWRHELEVIAGWTEVQLPAERYHPERKPEFYYLYYMPAKEKDAPETPYLFYDRRKLTRVAARSELPKVTMLDLAAGGAVPAGAEWFDVLVWQSRIPPYASYVAACDMERARQVVAAKKRLLNKRRRGQEPRRPW